MATCTQIIKLAMRKLKLLRAGANPTASEGVDYLAVLQDLYVTWVDKGRFGALTEVIATADYTAGENERIRADGHTITFPLNITDADTGLNRAPNDLALVVVITAGQEPVRKIYDANRGEWVSLTGLTANGEAPLSSRGQDGLAACLAVQIADENDAAIPEAVAVAQRAFLGRIASRKSTTADVVPVEFY